RDFHVTGVQTCALPIWWAVSVPPAAAYGTYLYSNTGYMVAAAMLERAMGETFERAMASRVLEPLGITDAGYGAQDAGGAAQPVEIGRASCREGEWRGGG